MAMRSLRSFACKMKNTLKYFLEFVIVVILVFAGTVPLLSIKNLDIHNSVSVLTSIFGVVCLFAVIGILYRWIKIFTKR